jgi:iron complex transport system permease protein
VPTGRHPARIVALLAASVGGVVVGSVVLESVLLRPHPISALVALSILLHALSGGRLVPDPCAGAALGPAGCSGATFIVVSIALPEILLALIVGAALGISGGALQGVFRNPLADPFLLGISSGGTLGAAIIYVYHFGEAQADLFLPLFSFLGAVSTGLLIFSIARGRYSSVETVLLSGVAIANLLSAVLSLVLLSNPFGAEQVTFWLLGGLSLASWTVDGIAFGGVLVLGTLLCVYGRELNLLQLGPEVAQSAGVDAPRVRMTVILLASLTTAVAVAFTGIIGFVGLVSPHIVRRLAGSDYRVVLPGAAAVGALLLLGANDVNVAAFPSSYLPLGIFTAFAGVPFFLLLLQRQRRRTPMGPG